MSMSARLLVESLEDRRLLAANPVGAKQWVPGAISQLRVGPNGRTISTGSGANVTRVNDTAASSNALKKANASLIQAGYQIEIRFPDNSLTDSQKAVFTAAAARWQSVILGDQPNVSANPFGAGTETIDDLVIQATAPAIDGAGGILGQAGPRGIRSSNLLPYSGIMQFDSADVAALESSGQLNAVILHEMGHVLGLGTIWSNKGLISGAGGSDPRFTGAQATAQYQAIFGVSTSTVPVENSGGTGTADGHWRENGGAGVGFGNELMTGYLNSGTNPLSRVTIGQYADLGYTSVNLNAFDVYTPPNGGNAYPTTSSLTPASASVAVGSTVDLTANGVNDSNGSVSAVRFYRETNGIPGLQVFAGTTGDVAADTLVATDTDSAGGWTASLAASGQGGLGTKTYYAQATDNQNLVSVNTTTNVTITPVTVTGVTIDDGTGQRSRVRSIAIALNSAVLPGEIQNGAITLTRQSGGSLPTVTTSSVINGNTTVITLTFSGGTDVVAGSLGDGRYQLLINGALISAANGGVDAAANGTAGSTLTVNFHRLFGDITGDALVNISDFGIFALAYNKTPGNESFRAGFDLNGDDIINIADFGAFALQYGFTV